MDAEKFTERARGFIQSAQQLALRSNHQQFTPEHLLKVLIDDEEGLAARLIAAAGGRPEQVREQVERALAKMPKVEGGQGQVYLSPEAARLFENAEQIAKKAGDSFVTAEYLLLALAMSSGDSARILKSAAPSRCCRGARRTIPSSSASPASARPLSPKASLCASSTAMCRRACATS